MAGCGTLQQRQQKEWKRAFLAEGREDLVIVSALGFCAYVTETVDDIKLDAESACGAPSG